MDGAAAFKPRAHAPRHVRAEIGFRPHRGRTYIARQHTPHPFHLTRPFYLDDDVPGMATLYLQSSAGGLFGDDDLQLALTLEDRAAAYVTTQSASVVHPARGGVTRQHVTIRCATGAWLEYVPDPAILFAGADARLSIAVEAADDATTLLADGFLSHDPDGDGAPASLAQELIVMRAGQAEPVFVDRFRLADASNPVPPPAPGFSCHGVVAAIAPKETRVEPVAMAIEDRLAKTIPADAGLWAVTALNDRAMAWCRLVCRDGATLSAALTAAWRGAREALTGAPPPPRRK